MGEPSTSRSCRALVSAALLLVTGCVEDAYRHFVQNFDAGGTLPLDAGRDAGTDAGTAADGGDAGGGSDGGPMCPVPTLSRLCTDAGWCWESPLPHGNTNNGLWAASSADVWAVASAGSITHWDGSRWSAVASPTEENLRGLWGSGPGDIWAGGEFGTLLHWDCSQWSLVTPSPGLADYATVRGLWGSGPSDVWLVGDDGAFHWDGGAWDGQAAAGTSLLSPIAVWGDAPNNYWAVGSGGGASHFDGVSWSAPEVASTLPLTSVWGSAGQVWAAGVGGVFHRDSPGVWSPTLTCAPITFSALWGSGTNDVWAAGTAGALWHFGGGSLPTDCAVVEGSWSPVPFAAVDLTSGASLSPKLAWVGGVGGTVASLNGGSWQVELGGSVALLDAVWADGDRAFAAGTSEGDGGAFYRGPGWLPEVPTGGVPSQVTSLTGASSVDVWGADDQGQIWHRGVSGWGLSVTLAQPGPETILETSTGMLWTAGTVGNVNEGTDAPVPGFMNDSSGLNGASLFALWAPHVGNQLWAAGTGGAMFYSDGDAGWTPISSGSYSDIFGLWADSASGTFFAIGRDGTIAQGPTNNLVNVDATPTTATLRGVWGSSASDVWSVGDRGKILHWDDGGAWTIVPSGTSNALYAVWGTDGGSDVWAVGEHRTVLHRH